MYVWIAIERETERAWKNIVLNKCWNKILLLNKNYWLNHLNSVQLLFNINIYFYICIVQSANTFMNIYVLSSNKQENHIKQSPPFDDDKHIY